jgi:hypothetical protein
MDQNIFISKEEGATNQGVSKWFFCHNFKSFQLFLTLSFALDLYKQHVFFVEEKFLEKFLEKSVL